MADRMKEFFALDSEYFSPFLTWEQELNKGNPLETAGWREAAVVGDHR